ncbi:MAG: hypothetical protein ACXABY_37540 [Candidatus Thorarchaeota archaeon]|jgi:hypothetical protein
MSEFLFSIVNPSAPGHRVDGRTYTRTVSTGTYQGTLAALLSKLQLELTGEQQRDVYLDGNKIAEITQNFHWVDPAWTKHLTN